MTTQSGVAPVRTSPRHFVVAGVLLASMIGVGPPNPTRDFESETPGKIARGFTAAAGRWEVVKDGDNQVLAQQARSDDDTFNVALVDGTHFQDLDLSVRLRAVAGELDRGGGLVWRARDARNYYIARFNPLEDNFRLYKVEAGKRTQFRSARVPGDTNWHTLRVTMTGPKISCFLDGTRYLDAEDTTFAGPGKVGLWSKADARSYFDDLTVSESVGQAR